jgi:hypothetical protein
MALLSNFIFSSRWLQLPLYLGLIRRTGGVRVSFLGRTGAPAGGRLWQPARAAGAGHQHWLQDRVQVTALNETIIMLVVLALIDVVMISNLLIMVIVGGYETFVSPHEPGRTPRPARVAEPCECLGAQGQAGHGHHRHQLHPPAQDLSSTPPTTTRRC